MKWVEKKKGENRRIKWKEKKKVYEKVRKRKKMGESRENKKKKLGGTDWWQKRGRNDEVLGFEMECED